MTRIETSLTRVLGIEVPLVQAPIGPCTCPELAAAVSNAGALGTLAATWQSPPDVADLLARTRALTDRPFAVNLILEWDQHDRLRACLDAGASIVSFFWGDPGPYVDAAHGAGALVIHTVGSPEEARRVVDAGVDVVVAQGVEAGGHVWGETGTLPLVPAVVDAVLPVPVLAAGGIADGRGLAAAVALGAAGAWIGTRFVATEESAAAPTYKQRVVEGPAEDAVLSTAFDGEWPGAKHRVLRNETVERWEEAGRPEPGSRPGEGDEVARMAEGFSIPRYSAMLPAAGVEGDLDALALYAGQSTGLVHDVLPAGEVVRRIEEEAATIIAGMHELLI